MLRLADQWGRRYGRRPSELLQSDPFEAALDLAAMAQGLEDEADRARVALDKGAIGAVAVVVGG